MLNVIVIKSEYIYKGLILGAFPEILVEISLDFHKILLKYKTSVFITSAFRKNSKGVHGYHRGIDYRCWDLTDDQIEFICLEINTKYQYDPERPSKKCLIHHDTGRGPHFHLQSHPNTELRKR
jgi:hypothetical protein